MSAVFGPIECHHLVSFYRKKGDFNPATVGLKKSPIERVEVPLNVPECFVNIAEVDFRYLSTTKAARTRPGLGVQFAHEACLTGVEDLSVLLRRGLGYRIIFNMDNLPREMGENEIIVPEMSVIITDLTGTTSLGSLNIPAECWIKHATPFMEFLSEMLSCDKIEFASTWDRVVITRDGKVELEFFHFDKLLSPEQLKIYNKYASVLGAYLGFNNCEDDAYEDNVRAMTRFADYVIGMGTGIANIALQKANYELVGKIRSKLSFALTSLLQEVLIPVEQQLKQLEDLDEDETIQLTCGLIHATKSVIEALKDLHENRQMIYSILRTEFASGIDKLLDSRPAFLELMSSQLESLTMNNETFLAEKYYIFIASHPITAVLAEHFSQLELARAGSDPKSTKTSSALSKCGPYRVRIHENCLQLTVVGEKTTHSYLSIPLSEDQLSRVQEETQKVDSEDDSDESEEQMVEPAKDDVEPPDADPDLEEALETDVEDIRTIRSPAKYYLSQWSEHYGFAITPMAHNRLLIRGKGLKGDRYLLVDLLGVYQMKETGELDKNIQDAWSYCSWIIEAPDCEPLYKLEQPILSHLSSTSIVGVGIEESEDYKQMKLYYLEIKGNKNYSGADWISTLVPDLSVTIGEFYLDQSALYHSVNSKLIFCAIEGSEDQTARLQLGCFDIRRECRQLALVSSTHMDTALDGLQDFDRSSYWMEKKGRVFFYCVQSSPEIKLLVICYHHNKFVSLGRHKGLFSLGSQHRCDWVWTADRVVGSVFRRRDHNARAHKFTLWALVPDF